MRRWGQAIVLGVAACAVLAGCTSAASGLAVSPPAGEPLAPTEAERVWARTDLPEDQRPAVEPVRLVSVFERPAVLAECLRAAGYPQVTASDGGIEPGRVPDELAGSFALSRYICEASYPTDPVFDRALSEAQIRALHRYRSAEQRECLVALGHLISRPPSEQAFVDGYAERGGWNPLTSVPAFRFDAAVAACPPLPEGFLEPAPVE